jgi:hypothetical protein
MLDSGSMFHFARNDDLKLGSRGAQGSLLDLECWVLDSESKRILRSEI